MRIFLSRRISSAASVVGPLAASAIIYKRCVQWKSHCNAASTDWLCNTFMQNIILPYHNIKQRPPDANLCLK